MKIDIKLLMRKKDELLAKRQAILDKIAEENRTYTDEERAEDKSLQEQVADFEEQIRIAQEIQNQRTGSTPEQIRAALNEPTTPIQSENFRSFGDFLQAIRFNPSHPSLKWRESIHDSEKRLMSMGVGAAGGSKAA